MASMIRLPGSGCGDAFAGRVFEVECDVGVDDGVDGVGGDCAFAEALEDELELARVGGDVADGEDAGGGGLAGRRVDADVAVLEVEAPGGDGAEIHREAEEGEEA